MVDLAHQAEAAHMAEAPAAVQVVQEVTQVAATPYTQAVVQLVVQD
jgi:hypothetical protein